MPAASSHDRIDAGPAASAALSAPSSQPDPMIEPSETNIRPQNPTERLSWPACELVVSIGARTISRGVYDECFNTPAESCHIRCRTTGYPYEAYASTTPR